MIPIASGLKVWLAMGLCGYAVRNPGLALQVQEPLDAGCVFMRWARLCDGAVQPRPAKSGILRHIIFHTSWMGAGSLCAAIP